LTLSKPEVNPHAPNWFIGLRESTQANMDAQFLHEFSLYEERVKGWLETNERLRAAYSGPVPYVPTPAPVPPKREVYDWDDMPVSRWVSVAVTPPVLPPYTKSQSTPNAGFVSTPDPKDAALFALLGHIQADVAAIKSKLSA
jgi:hypothetical protein